MPKPSSELPSSVLDENGNLRVLFRHGFKIVEFNDQHYAEAMTEEELETVAARNGHSDLCAGCYMSNGWCENNGCHGNCRGVYDAQYWYCICE